MKTQQKFLVTAFVVLACSTLMASFIEKDKRTGILSEIVLTDNNLIVIRLEGDSSLYYINKKSDRISISQYNSKYLGKLFEIEFNKPLFFDTNTYPVISLKKDKKLLFSSR